jgi:hypothetical protein
VTHFCLVSYHFFFGLLLYCKLGIPFSGDEMEI